MSDRLLLSCRVLGIFATNTYFLTNKDTSETIIVDPADRAEYIADQCRIRGFKPVAIMLTHGHVDHILAVNGLKSMWDIPVCACAAEQPLLLDPQLNRSLVWSSTPASIKADVLFADGAVAEYADFRIKVIATPGHTAGSCCYYLEDEGILLSGDTLFFESYGRTDLETGSFHLIERSIREKLLTLPPDVRVLPGHEEMTTIGHEREANPILEGRPFDLF